MNQQQVNVAWSGGVACVDQEASQMHGRLVASVKQTAENVLIALYLKKNTSVNFKCKMLSQIPGTLVTSWTHGYCLDGFYSSTGLNFESM